MKVLLISTDIDHIEPHQYLGLKQKGADILAIMGQTAVNTDVLESAGIPIFRASFAKRRDEQTMALIREKIDAFNPDIIHVLRKKALSNTIPAMKGSKAKLVTYRGIVGNLSFLDPISWMTFLNPRVDRIICVAEAIRQHFLKMGWGPFKIPPEKLVTIHKGHKIERYEHIEKIDLSQFGIPNGARVIGCTASMRPRKGVDILVNAFSNMVSDNAHLLLVGEVKDKRIDKAIQNSPAKTRIHVLGQVPQAVALSIAGSVDVITMPSTKREGLPRALIEAMAQGTPAVVTNVGGSPELVINGKTGWVVPPHNVQAMTQALDKMLENPNVLSDMGEASKTHMNTHFHVNQTIEKTWALYQDVLNRS